VTVVKDRERHRLLGSSAKTVDRRNSQYSIPRWRRHHKRKRARLVGKGRFVVYGQKRDIMSITLHHHCGARGGRAVYGGDDADLWPGNKSTGLKYAIPGYKQGCAHSNNKQWPCAGFGIEVTPHH